MTGMKFGRLSVLRRADAPGRPQGVYWLCQCDCGKETVVFGKRLTRPNRPTPSCGCVVNEKGDLAGKRVGKLVVVQRAEPLDDSGDVFWLCQCDCGKAKVIRGQKLRKPSQPTRSCGCLREKLIRLEGKVFGKLTVISLEGYRDKGRKKKPLWRCLCECGQESVVLGGNLTKGNSTSCGCSRLLSLDGEGNRRAVIRKYKRHAFQGGREWRLEDDEAVSLFESNCHYCGSPPSNAHHWKDKRRRGYDYSGIDRINNELGYIPGNVVACCRVCNFAKGSTSYADFVAWAKRIGRHQLGLARPESVSA